VQWVRSIAVPRQLEVIMLVLSRKPDEAIIVADKVKICVLSVKGKQVRLGIEAPRDVAVNRKEVHQKMETSHEDVYSNADDTRTSNT